MQQKNFDGKKSEGLRANQEIGGPVFLDMQRAA
jgi:hypothetical protein